MNTKKIYISFEVHADSYQEAESKLRQHFKNVDTILSDTILAEGQEKQIRSDLSTMKFVNHSRI